MLFEDIYTKHRDLRVHIDSPVAYNMFCNYFVKTLADTYNEGPLVIMCIGTDRSTGDALGPLVGERLHKVCKYAKVFGNLEEPVHAVNLEKVLDKVQSTYKNPFIIAIDASLGRSENVGTIKIAPGALKPGAGVNKNLPPVGDFHVTGVVNVAGFMEYLVLQNTRLFTVMKMVDIISVGILEGLELFFGKNKSKINTVTELVMER
ncbi:spore protease YyaC [Tepidanaerobacter sp. GT38]|uniref:spore protease YyaC n=1 Tax=Tepidanaerobacter sp. GT38 TaxID=2722793 RepID=UPI001F192683|nr:spore protease YyaC [Tepidanaerobacter sp. GT38]MCG1011699.1 spore protease YyaC [Tepidanaerobacter sp. GT38]